MVLYPITRTIELVLQTKINKKISYLYLAYDFLKNNVSELCVRLYGSACSVDKARYLVKAYINWKETGNMPVFKWGGDYVFHYPQTGTEEQWMAFIDGVQRLKYGHNKEYLLALNELMNTKEDKSQLKRQDGPNDSN